ncbi:hypothetical protein SI65_09457 [Aspergillus cristatus]|uniref:Mitochondrial import receptor subunit n=1 Tax=Aspergillus cristatus TaxID=573508 RepID=A0A1E3B2U2_ASPCR|nr:hypothetical protein SI65_09457 [Aspergillus cristatus]
MVLELHIWGPAFSLPSIDPQCLAAVAYFSLAVPNDNWVLVPSSDPSVSPTNELPALRNGSTWVSRFRNIVNYLRQYSDGSWDLDRGLGEVQRADNIALSSFLESRGQPLLDLSLYVTSQNYYNHTSPAYASILQWPNQWILPPKLHSAAKTRTEHLGVSSLDLEALEEQRKREHSAAVAAGQVPQNFIQRPRDTVSGLLGKTSQQNQFKLEGLTAELFEPLEEILGDKEYLLSDSAPCSLDCLALGYLALAVVPEMSYTWLRDAMQSKGPGVTSYMGRMLKRCVGSKVDVAQALEGVQSPSSPLPWQAPERANMVKVGGTLLNTLVDATPIVRDIRNNNRLREAAESSDLSGIEKQALSQYVTGQKKDVFLSMAMVAGGVAALIGYVFHVGLFGVVIEEEAEAQEEEAGEVDLNNLDLSASDFLAI